MMEEQEVLDKFDAADYLQENMIPLPEGYMWDILITEAPGDVSTTTSLLKLVDDRWEICILGGEIEIRSIVYLAGPLTHRILDETIRKAEQDAFSAGLDITKTLQKYVTVRFTM